MPRGFVLLNADLGYESTLAAEMKNMEGVTDSYTVYGVYDIMLKIEADSMERLKEFIGAIRKTKGVKSSLTMLIMD